MDGWWGAGPVVSAESATPSIYIYMPRDGHRYPFEFNGSSDERESSTFWRKGWLATMGE